MLESLEITFGVAVLIMSVVAHEVSHGYAAALQGDPTARMAGRLTLNPIKHIDPIGSVVVPFISYMMGGFIFGWAKPVPYNPYNLRNQRTGPALVAIAGPAINLFLALVFGLALRYATELGLASEAFMSIGALVVYINILLAVFNLIPIPPLDGSKVLYAILPTKWLHIAEHMERYSFLFVLLFVFFLWRFILPIVFFLFSLITGMAL
ncbi:MAG: site-2 protease family protein [Candidatus Yonathbacteria bacterium]|nr:site-2 protease family protein [Candidatus Yonathbacteria bacterium]NTW47544.1 site-2 protease family protein [Candidatus Yonathbacteria bacterium]